MFRRRRILDPPQAGTNAMSVASRTGQLQVGEWLVDPALDRLSRGSEIVKLEPRTMRLLLRLCESPGQVMSPQQLLDDVWSGVVVGPASVYQAISQLRKLLLDTDPAPTYIATIPRKGYRLIAPVRRIAAACDPLSDRQGLPRSDRQNDPQDDPQDDPHPGPASGEIHLGQEQTRGARHSGWVRHAWWAIGLTAVMAGASILLLRDDSLTQGWLAMSWFNWFREGGSGASEPAIVVLPFIDMTADHRDEAFCDGLTEELSTTLSQLPALRVVARTSAFAFRDRNVDVREIGRKLAATHVLEGSVRRSGDAIRVTAQLIDARRGYHSWSESYDLRSKDVLRLQSDIARSVAAALELRFPEAASRNVVVRSDDPAAYELYLLGRHYYRQRTPEANARAAELNSKAIALDRNFAAAYVGLAQARLNEFALAGRPVHELAAQIEPLLDTALQLNPNLSEAYATRGALHRELNRLDEAKSDLARAIALNHNNVQAVVNLGRVFEYEGQPRQALESFTQARMLDPLDFMRHVDRCVALQDLGRYAEAEVDCAEARTLQPQSKWGYMASGWLARAKGQKAQALQWNDEALRVAPADIDLYLQRIDELMDLGMLEAVKAVLQRTAAESKSGDDSRLRIRYADVLMIERGPAAVRDYLAQLDLRGVPASDLLTAAQVSVTAGDYRQAEQLTARAVAAADFPEVELAHRTAIKWGTSHELLLALLELHNGDRQAAVERVTRLLRLIDELERNGYATWGIHSLRADALGLLGDADGAMRSLQQAVDAGWRSAWAAQRDPYLASLFERSDFRELMQRVEQLNATERSRYPTPAA